MTTSEIALDGGVIAWLSHLFPTPKVRGRFSEMSRDPDCNLDVTLKTSGCGITSGLAPHGAVRDRWGEHLATAWRGDWTGSVSGAQWLIINHCSWKQLRAWGSISVGEWPAGNLHRKLSPHGTSCIAYWFCLQLFHTRRMMDSIVYTI